MNATIQVTLCIEQRTTNMLRMLTLHNEYHTTELCYVNFTLKPAISINQALQVLYLKHHAFKTL